MVSEQGREVLLKWKRSPTTPQKLVRRAEIVLSFQIKQAIEPSRITTASTRAILHHDK